MYVYSKWLLTDGSRESVSAFAEILGQSVGEAGPSEVEDGNGTIFRRVVEYEDAHSSEWDAAPKSPGRWIVGVANVDARDSFNSRLVGVLTPSASLTEHLAADLADHLKAERAGHEPVVFMLSSLLGLTHGKDAAHASSVRLVDDNTRVLVQSSDQEALRAALAGLDGTPVGVTMKTGEGQVTITDQGSVIFSDSTSATDVLGLMNTIVDVQAVPLAATASAWI